MNVRPAIVAMLILVGLLATVVGILGSTPSPGLQAAASPRLAAAAPIGAADPSLDRVIPGLRFGAKSVPAPTAPATPQPVQDAPQLAPVAPAACAKQVDVNLTTQQLVATECGDVFVTTAITSGRPGLRTPTGTFTVFLMEQDVYFYSPWPAGDPNYYPPMFVAYAMEFLDGGYFLHTDPDEPADAFGPGSQDGPYASHGCVHVPLSVMVNLYGWAGDGTTVSIHY